MKVLLSVLIGVFCAPSLLMAETKKAGDAKLNSNAVSTATGASQAQSPTRAPSSQAKPVKKTKIKK